MPPHSPGSPSRSLHLILLASSAVLLVCVSTGCRRGLPQISWPDQNDFHVDRAQVNPSFTRIYRSQEGLERPDRLDAYVELYDQFGDPMKATGQFRFEFYLTQRKPSPLPRGRQIGTVLISETDDPLESQKHWDKITRCFVISLEIPPLPEDVREIELVLTFIKGRRLEHSMVLKIPE